MKTIVFFTLNFWVGSLLFLITSTMRGQSNTPIHIESTSSSGKVLFEQNCSKCHGIDGTKGLFGAKKVTEAIGIYDKFDLVLTRDDVENGKPAPDIYNRAKEHFGLSSEQCLVIEDSPNGIMAAQNAGMPVFAVTNSITRAAVHDCNLLDPGFIIDDLTQLETVVCDFLDSRTH